MVRLNESNSSENYEKIDQMVRDSDWGKSSEGCCEDAAF